MLVSGNRTKVVDGEVAVAMSSGHRWHERILNPSHYSKHPMALPRQIHTRSYDPTHRYFALDLVFRLVLYVYSLPDSVEIPSEASHRWQETVV